LKLERSIVNLAKKLDKLHPEFSSCNSTGLNHWKDKPIIPLEEWIKFRDTPKALHYFPDDFDQTSTYMELPYYRYEFERKKRRLEGRRRSDGWLNDEVRYGPICHDSRGNLTDGLGNPIKEGHVVEEEEQDRDEELRLTQTQTRTRRHTEVVFRLYSTNGAYQESELYFSLC
jgi:hypothetical protein